MENTPNAWSARRSPPWLPLGAAIALVVLALAIAFALLLVRVAPAPAPDVGPGATLLPAPRALPEFALMDQDGEAFDLRRLQGRWSFLFFGYTSCPDVCPGTLAVLRDVHAELADAGIGVEETQFVFVSVDPDRDTPERLREYVSYFHRDFVGATGAPQQLDRLTRFLGVHHRRSRTEGDPDYLLDHTSAVLLIDPAARLSAVLSDPHDPHEIADSFRRIRSLGGLT